MADDDLCCGANCAVLPEEIKESLEKYGGVEGLLKMIPTEADILAGQAVHRALADQSRLKILALLKIQPLCVCVIKAALCMADSRLSYHLSVMKKAGLIRGEQQGNWIIYSLTDEGEKWA